ncbi:MAG: methylmalonyl-CoA mutase family protein [Anaerolineaceae bacterium]|nr:methylmalonyl-CoA mutase family protein [Anaerolineaceae bacterium]
MKSKQIHERKERYAASSAIDLHPHYSVSEGDEIPGEYPFTRGIHRKMYRSRLWTMRQYAGFGSAAETNERFRFLLEKGQSGLSVAFDLPTQIGYDADHPLAEGEVGKVGVSICSLQDMEALFAGIPLNKVSTSMTINAPAAILLAMYIACGKRQGVEERELRGTVQNDILKEYIARGTYIFPPEPSMRLITDLMAHCQQHIPHWNTLSVSGYHIREAGSSAVQEVAFTLANAIAYVQAALAAGLKIDDFAPQISFFFNAHNHLWEEVAKFRAARRIWAKTMKERFAAKEPRSLMLRFHTQTGGSTLTAQQPENNVVRVTLQALAAILGGTQSLHTNSMDEALGLPTVKAAQIALRTQQILAHESGVADIVDPLGGSPLIETLTDQIEGLAQEYIRQIDELGGSLSAIESGWLQNEILNHAYRTQRSVESGETLIVGVNAYQQEAEEVIPTLRSDPEFEQHQRSALAQLRAQRDTERVSTAQARLLKAAKTSENLMPFLIDCVEHYVTIGEICQTLRNVFGEFQAHEIH